MYTQIHQMTPLLPEKAEDLKDLSLEIAQKSAALGGRLHALTLRSLQDMLRIINSYYSNLIEGHNTHPYDIVRAMRGIYDQEPAKRDLQQESVAHVAVQRYMEHKLQASSHLRITSRDFLCDIHREFYRQLPEAFRVVRDARSERTSLVVPGALRTESVRVGYHEPPAQERLGAFLDRFEDSYDPSRHHGSTKLIAAAAAHHRLMWIHPFLDGNGRVTRLFTEAYLSRIPVHGLGLWTVNRGLARRNADYKAALAGADAPRWNDLDGRGNLSNGGLLQFCRFFLETCLDQVEYIGGLLHLDGLANRIRQYVRFRNTGVIPGPATTAEEGRKLRNEAVAMFQELLLHGEVSRGRLVGASGLKERTGRTLLAQLLEEGLFVSDTPKGNVRLAFPIHAAGWFFPELYPTQHAFLEEPPSDPGRGTVR